MTLRQIKKHEKEDKSFMLRLESVLIVVVLIGFIFFVLCFFKLHKYLEKLTSIDPFSHNMQWDILFIDNLKRYVGNEYDAVCFNKIKRYRNLLYGVVMPVIILSFIVLMVID
jgi:hypothetical protein